MMVRMVIMVRRVYDSEEGYNEEGVVWRVMVRRVITMRRVYDGEEGYNNEEGV